MSRKKTAEYVFTGTPCKRGHVGPRYKNGNCVECLLQREREKQSDPVFADEKRKRAVARYSEDVELSRVRVRLSRDRNKDAINGAKRAKYHADPDTVKALVKLWRDRNPEKVKEIDRKHHAANRENRNARSRLYRIENRERLQEKSRSYSRDHYLTQPHYYNEKRSARRAGIFTATPTWADRAAMREIYRFARIQSLESGVPMSVDHIVPLRGEINGEWVVCGLHCEANLQIMSLVENKSKGARHWPDMPEKVKNV